MLTSFRTTGARASRLPLSFFQIPCNIKVILLDIVNVPQLWSTPAGHEELAGGFKQPSNQRRRNILNNNHAIYSLSTPTSCLLTLLHWVCLIVFKDLSLWKLLAHFLQKYIFVKKQILQLYSSKKKQDFYIKMQYLYNRIFIPFCYIEFLHYFLVFWWSW